MYPREKVEKVFREFVLGWELETADLLVVVECAVREMAARETISTDSVQRILSTILEEERV